MLRQLLCSISSEWLIVLIVVSKQ